MLKLMQWMICWAALIEPGGQRASEAQALLDAATRALHAGDHDAAIRHASRCLAVDPGSARASLVRGSARARKGDPRGALDDLTRAIRIDPEDPLAWIQRGFVRLEILERNTARSDLEEAIRLDPLRPLGHAYLGLLSIQEGKPEEALRYLDAAIARHPSPWVHGARGRVRALLGDQEGAIADLERELASSSTKSCSAFWILGLGGSVQDPLPHCEDEFARERLLHLQGVVSRQRLLRLARDVPEEQRRRQRLCEAFAAAALRAELDRDPDTARAYYRRCLETGVHMFHEYSWAKLRLRSLDSSRSHDPAPLSIGK